MNHAINSRFLILLGLILSGLFLMACSPVVEQPVTEEEVTEQEVVIPATVPATESASATATIAGSPTEEVEATVVATAIPEPSTAATSQPTVVSTDCTDAAAFVADITIPDNVHVEPDTGFVKTWRVQNSGSCTWESGYQLIHLGGDLLGASDSSLSIPTSVAPGQTLDLTIEMVSPPAAGAYHSDWILVNSQGVQFGIGTHDTPLWVKLIVDPSDPIKQSSIRGFAWQDQDFDDQVDADELLPDVLITLSTGANCGSTLQAVNTDSDGLFQFYDLAAGNYCLTGTDGSVTVSQSGIVLNENQVQTDINVAWPPIRPEPAAISGWVWLDHCAVHTGEDGLEDIDGHCVDDGNGGYIADGMIEPEEGYIAGVSVELRIGTCEGGIPSILQVAETNGDGNYSFDQLQPGSYCVSIDASESSNAAVLDSGRWTFPQQFVNHHEITLNAGEQAAPVNFGWDYDEVEE